jgi:hypothetical protein
MRLKPSKFISLVLIPLLISACVAPTYEIHPDEVSRILKAEPAERGAQILVAQETEESVEERHTVTVWHPYGHHHHGYASPPPRRFRRGFGPQTSEDQTKDKIADEKEAAFVLVVIGLFVTFALIGTEGSRFQGEVTVDPNHPVHILGNDGSYAWNYLASLKEEDLQPGDRLIIAEDEGKGFTFHDRLPLDREGFVWRMELGTSQNNLPNNQNVMGPAARMNLGYFGNQTLGFGFMLNFMGGSDGPAEFFTTQYGLELQAMPFNAGGLHLGLYGWGGFAYNVASGGRLETFENHSPAAGGGLLLEWDLNTTLALNFRAGGSWESHGDSLEYRGMTTLFGVSVY